jgi:hypothetical protein
MDDMRPGDIVFHWAKRRLRAVSEVLVGSRQAQRPYESDAWEDLGREVRVNYQDLDLPLTLEEIPLDFRLSQSAPGEPFTYEGSVKLGYLFRLSAHAGVELLDRAGLVVRDQDLTADPVDATGAPRMFAFTVDSTDGTVKALYRKEQGALRRFLFGDLDEGICAFCGRRLPTRLLVTAHIKPRSKCTDAERRDPHTVVAACTLGCDALFEYGYLVVDGNGNAKAGRPVKAASDLETSLRSLIGRKVPIFGER